MKISSAFNRAAATYDMHSTLQDQVSNTLISLLPVNQMPMRILDLGCGTGKTTKLLTQRYHYDYFAAVDFASHLIGIAKQNLNIKNMHFFEKDFDQPILFPHLFNLVFSNMSLQWSKQLNTTLKLAISYLASDGLLAITLPTKGTLNELSTLFAINQFPVFESLQHSLLSFGCELITSFKQHYTLTFDNTIDALRSLRYVGATHVINRTSRPLLGKQKINQSAIQILTYEIAFIIARKL